MVGLPYPITVARGALNKLGEVARKVAPGNRVVAFTDMNVGDLYASRVAEILGKDAGQAEVTAIPMDEKRKTRETWAHITDLLLSDGCGRDTTIVALGGGVVGDVVGFVAATYMRGIPFIQVPTTLLAMVDASIGGKTGVDTPAGKNLVGAFHQPSAVIVDPELLATLPMQHLREGFAEMVKHGVVADAKYFESAKMLAHSWPASSADLPDLTALIKRSIEIKADIVGRDERESGLRKVLNFGHTIGHAVEAQTQYATPHGHAVAIGMVAEARLAEVIGVAQTGTAEAIKDVFKAAGLPTSLPKGPIDALIEFTRADKKVRRGRVHYALPKRVGEMAGSDKGWVIPVDDDAVIKALA